MRLDRRDVHASEACLAIVCVAILLAVLAACTLMIAQAYR